MVRSKILLLFYFILFNSVHAAPIKILGETDFFPYSYENEKGEPVGFTVDVVKEVFKKLGRKIDLKLVPWARALNKVKSGVGDFSFSYFLTQERLKFLRYTDVPLNISQYKLLVRRDKVFKFNSINDLSGKKLGYISQYFLPEFLKALTQFEKLELVDAIRYEQLEGLLRFGRIDTFPINVASSAMYSSKEFVVLDKLLYEGDVYLVMSKKSSLREPEKMILRINKELEVMNKNGTMARLRKKYFNLNPKDLSDI